MIEKDFSVSLKQTKNFHWKSKAQIKIYDIRTEVFDFKKTQYYAN